MSIATEITRLQTAKADLKTAIEGKGVAVTTSALLDDYADLVDSIPSGGGGIDIADIVRRTQPSGAVVATLTAGAAEHGLAHFPAITSVHLTTPALAAYLLEGSSACTIFVGEGACSGNFNVFNNAKGIETVDFSADIGASFSNGYFRYTKLTKLILRKSSLVTLMAIGAFNDSPFASNGTGGTLYVPSALISTYQANTNWSTILGYANNSIQAIEGSIYETQYADGTPIT